MSKQCAFPNCGYYANPNSKYCAFHAGEIDDLDDLEALAKEVNATWEQQDAMVMNSSLPFVEHIRYRAIDELGQEDGAK